MIAQFAQGPVRPHAGGPRRALEDFRDFRKRQLPDPAEKQDFAIRRIQPVQGVSEKRAIVDRGGVVVRPGGLVGLFRKGLGIGVHGQRGGFPLGGLPRTCGRVGTSRR